jgi:hypothetical protein
MMQDITPLHTYIVFNTFIEPSTAQYGEPVGAYSIAKVTPKIEGNVTFHQGLFNHTILKFL